MKQGLSFILVTVLLTACSTSGVAPEPPPPIVTAIRQPTIAAPTSGAPSFNRTALSINFGDYESAAELTYPAVGAGAFPTVVLIPGSGPEDLNATVCAANAHPPVPLSHIFLDISTALTAHGYAVLRYDKHYVTAPCQADQPKFSQLDLPQMLKDAEQVLRTAEANPHVDAKRIFVYGWSEGSLIAAALAANHPELAGLIVQGPVTAPWRDTFKYQFDAVQLPYLLSFAPDGRVTVQTIRQVLGGSGGLVAKGVSLYLIDPSFYRTHQLAVNAFFDKNHTGVIRIDTELTPNVDAYLSILLSPLAIYAPDRALPTPIEQASKLQLPVLILQGENDANVPVDGARRLDAALSANPDHTIELYPGLGHSLGPAASLIDDNFRPIAAAPLNGLVTWLAARSK